MNLKFTLLTGMVLLAHVAIGQNFNPMRYDEEYSGLKDSAKTVYNKIKYMPLSENGSTYVSLGGEVRGEIDYSRNEDWGSMNLGTDIFFLQRYHLHADLRMGNRLRIFGQLRSGLENGRKLGPRPIDEDQLNVQNLFLDIVPYRAQDESLTVRLGRQEIEYGSGRLIDMRDGPNLRLYFDGAKIAYASSKLHMDAFVMADALLNTGLFDNSSTYKPNLWGIYNTFISQKKNNFDFYYLGINRREAKFDEGVGRELRHTLGARLWRTGIGFVYNFEAGYQFGTFGINRISSFGLSSEIGYKFDQVKKLPSLKLRSDYISGDKAKDDGVLGSFNALYPNGGYFGMNPQVGPSNLVSIHPNLNWNPIPHVTFTLDVLFSWRQSTEDGVYGPSGLFRLSSFDSSKRFIGTAYITTFTWNISDSLNYNLGIQYFETGSFINDIIPQHRDGFFVGSSMSFKF